MRPDDKTTSCCTTKSSLTSNLENIEILYLCTLILNISRAIFQHIVMIFLFSFDKPNMNDKNRIELGKGMLTN